MSSNIFSYHFIAAAARSIAEHKYTPIPNKKVTDILTDNNIHYSAIPFDSEEGGTIELSSGVNMFFGYMVETYTAYLLLSSSNISIKNLMVFIVIGDEANITTTSGSTEVQLASPTIKKVNVNRLDPADLARYNNIAHEIVCMMGSSIQFPVLEGICKISNETDICVKNSYFPVRRQPSHAAMKKRNKQPFPNFGIFREPNGSAWVLRREIHDLREKIRSLRPPELRSEPFVTRNPRAGDKKEDVRRLYTLMNKFRCMVRGKNRARKICMNMNDDSLPRWHDADPHCFCRHN